MSIAVRPVKNKAEAFGTDSGTLLYPLDPDPLQQPSHVVLFFVVPLWVQDGLDDGFVCIHQLLARWQVSHDPKSRGVIYVGS